MSDYRRTDGLDASGTSDAYGSDNRDRVQRDDEVFGSRGGADSTGMDRSGGYGDRTSGGLGSDDTIGRSGRTGGGDYAGDQERSSGTSGGLGHNDTYGRGRDTGGNDTGYDHNYGVGTGRTYDQEQGGVLPTEPGRTDDRDAYDSARERKNYDEDQSGTVQERGVTGNRGDDYSGRSGSGNTYGDSSTRTGDSYGDSTSSSNRYGDSSTRTGDSYGDSTSSRTGYGDSSTRTGDNYGDSTSSDRYGDSSARTGDNYGDSTSSGNRYGDSTRSDDTYGGDTGYGDSSSGQKDSTMGKIMEKAGGLLKNESLQQKGAQKRSDASDY